MNCFVLCESQVKKFKHIKYFLICLFISTSSYAKTGLEAIGEGILLLGKWMLLTVIYSAFSGSFITPLLLLVDDRVQRKSVKISIMCILGILPPALYLPFITAILPFEDFTLTEAILPFIVISTVVALCTTLPAFFVYYLLRKKKKYLLSALASFVIALDMAVLVVLVVFILMLFLPSLRR